MEVTYDNLRNTGTGFDYNYTAFRLSFLKEQYKIMAMKWVNFKMDIYICVYYFRLF